MRDLVLGLVLGLILGLVLGLVLGQLGRCLRGCPEETVAGKRSRRLSGL